MLARAPCAADTKRVGGGLQRSWNRLEHIAGSAASAPGLSVEHPRTAGDRPGAPRERVGSLAERQGAPWSPRERQGAPRSAREPHGAPGSARERQGVPGSPREPGLNFLVGAAKRFTCGGYTLIRPNGRRVVASPGTPRFGLAERLNPLSPVDSSGATLYESAKFVCG